MSLLEKFMSFRERRIEREIDDMEIREEIISIGYEKGLAETQKFKIETAKKLLKNNVPLNVIVDATGLTEEEIKTLSD